MDSDGYRGGVCGAGRERILSAALGVFGAPRLRAGSLNDIAETARLIRAGWS